MEYNYCTSSIFWFFSFFGMLVFIYQAIKFLHAIYWTRIRGPHNLIQRYGKGSYAVITGSTAGIGQGYAHELARQGFNIVLMARNSHKLQKVESELKRINPEVQVVKISKDFEMATQSGFFDDIKETLNHLDISLLVNNVGITEWASVANTQEEKLGDSIIVSSYFPAMLTRILLPQMLARQKRGGILFMSSHNGLIPMGYFTTDSANKAFDDAFAVGLRQEVGDRLDVLSVAPVEAVTQGNVSKETSWRIASSEEMACSALRDLGIHNRTHGPRNQKLMTMSMLLVPQPIMSYIGTKVCEILTAKYPHGSKSL